MTNEEKKIDPVATVILEALRACEPGSSVSPSDIARLLAERRRRAGDPPELWRRYLQAVNEQARFLARQGRIDILRRGERQDPHAPIKGLVRLRLAEDGGGPA